MNFIKRLLKSKVFWIIAVIAVIGGVVIAQRGGDEVEYVTETVERSTLRQVVSATGTVESVSEVDLNFNNLGTLEQLFVEVGDQVEEGQLLATLDASELDAQIRQAQARVSLQQANLTKVLRGANDEDVRVSAVSLEVAQTAYDNAVADLAALTLKLDADESALSLDLENTQTSTDLAIRNARTNLLISLDTAIANTINARNQVNVIFEDPDFANQYSVENIANKVSSENAYLGLAPLIEQAQASFDSADATLAQVSIETAIDDVQTMLKKAQEMAQLVLIGINASTTDFDFNQTDLDAYRTAVESDQSSIFSSQVDVRAKEQAWQSAITDQNVKVKAAQAALDSGTANNAYLLSQAQAKVSSTLAQRNLAQAQLDQTTADADSEDILSAQAQVDEALAAVDILLERLQGYEIHAPFAGIVANIVYDEGENLTEFQPVLTVIRPETFEITVNIPESDITKVDLGDAADITLDAYGDDELFMGTVIHIDPAQTEIQDVVFYEVKLELDPGSRSVKQGMTANVDILTQQEDGVISIPRRAVLQEDGRMYVRVLVNGDIEQRDVATGFRGEDGRIQITSGLGEGDEVIIFERSNN